MASSVTLEPIPGGIVSLAATRSPQYRHHEREGQVPAGHDAGPRIARGGQGQGQREAPGAQDAAHDFAEPGVDERTAARIRNSVAAA